MGSPGAACSRPRMMAGSGFRPGSAGPVLGRPLAAGRRLAAIVVGPREPSDCGRASAGPHGSSRSSSRCSRRPVAMYPSLFAFRHRCEGTARGRRVRAGRHCAYANELKLRLGHTLDQIDAMVAAARAIRRQRPAGEMAGDRSRVGCLVEDRFSRPYRLTSAVELYGADGRLVSRFENPPGVRDGQRVRGDQPAPGGSVRRSGNRSARVRGTFLRAQPAGSASRGRPIGAVGPCGRCSTTGTLPFISSAEARISNRYAPQHDAGGVEGAVWPRPSEFAVYGWRPGSDLRVGHTGSGRCPIRCFDRVRRIA